MSVDDEDDEESCYRDLEDLNDHISLMYDHLWCRARVFDSKVIEISELLCDTAESDWTDDKKKELIFRARNAFLARRELLSMPRDPVDDVRKPSPCAHPGGTANDATGVKSSRWTLLDRVEDVLSPKIGNLIQFQNNGISPGLVPIDPLPPPPPKNIPLKAVDDVFHLRKKIRAILNKVTVSNFERLSGELAGLELDTPWATDLLLHLAMQRAIEEPLFSELYVKLLLEIRARYVKSDGFLNFERVIFRDQLVHEIQQEFSEALIDLRLLFEIPSAGPKSLLRESIASRRNDALQCMRLLGSFFCKGLFTLETLKKVVNPLIFDSTSTPLPFEVECAIVLLESTGKHLDFGDDRSRAFCSCVLGRLVMLKTTLSDRRLRILIFNLEKQRESKWREIARIRRLGNSEGPSGGSGDKLRSATRKKKVQGLKGSKFFEVFTEESFRACRDMYQEDGSLEKFVSQAEAMIKHDASCVRNMVDLLLRWGPAALHKKKSKEADLIAELVLRGFLPFELLDETLRAFLQDLDENCARTNPTYEFVEKLYAVLLTADYGHPDGPTQFDSALFLSWEVLHSDSKAFDMGLGILRLVKERAGLEGVRKSLAALRPVAGPFTSEPMRVVAEPEGFWDPLPEHEIDNTVD